MNSIPITFILKKFISAFLTPMPVTLGLILLGLIFLWFTKKQKLGKILVTTGTLLLLVFSSGFFANYLLKVLENKYPPYQHEHTEKIKFVVVLDGGGILKTDISPTIALKPFGTLGRLLEGIRIYMENPGSRLVLDGPYIKNTDISDADVLASIAVYYGVKKEDIITVPGVLDTADEAESISKIIGKEPFALVTSATHLPRAMLLFGKYGLRPVPAPSAYLQNGVSYYYSIGIPLPNAENIFSCEQVLHEYIGILWAKAVQ